MLREQLLARIGELLGEHPPAGAGPLVACIGGFPYMGKTELAHDAAARWPGAAAVLPTESVIASRAHRLATTQDGSHESSHDMAALVGIVEQLRAGEAASVPEYSWTEGRWTGTQAMGPLGRADLLLIDGSVATTATALALADVAVALRPLDEQLWLHLATERDVRERAWAWDQAWEQNLAKARTVGAQLADFGQLPAQLLIDVDTRGSHWAMSEPAPAPLS